MIIYPNFYNNSFNKNLFNDYIFLFNNNYNNNNFDKNSNSKFNIYLRILIKNIYSNNKINL